MLSLEGGREAQRSAPISQAGVGLRILELNPKGGRDPHSQ